MEKFYIGVSVHYETGAVLENAQIEQLAIAPTNPGVGQLYFHSDNADKTLRIYDGAEWRTLVDTTALASKAPTSSPTFTGSPTSVTFAATESSTRIATTRYVKNVVAAIVAADIGDLNAAIDSRVNALVDTAAGNNNALDTLTEIITAIQNNGDNMLSGIPRKYTETIGDGALTEFRISHNLNTRDIQVSVFEAAAPYKQVQVGISAASVNSINLSVAVAPANNSLKVIVVG